MDQEPSGSGRDKSLSYPWWLFALEPMLSWQSGELLAFFSLPLSLLLPSSLLPSFFCISALGSPRCHVLSIWAYVSLCCKYYRCLVAGAPRREQGQPLP